MKKRIRARKLNRCEKFIVSATVMYVLQFIAYFLSISTDVKLVILTFVALRLYKLGDRYSDFNEKELEDIGVNEIIVMAITMLIALVISVVIVLQAPIIGLIFILGRIVDKYLGKIIPKKFVVK